MRLLFGHWKSRVTLTSVISLILSSNSVQAGIQTDRKVTMIFVQSFEELKRNDLAIQYLEKHLREDEASAEIWGYLAKKYLDAQRPEKAAEAFGKAAQYASSADVAVYNYQRASASAQAKQVDQARNYLTVAANDPTVKPSAEVAMSQIVAGQPLPQLVRRAPSKWQSSASIKVGYDDNVLLYSDTALATTKQTETASFFQAPTVEATYLRPVDLGQLTASFNFSAQLYDNSNADVFESLNVSQFTSLNHNFIGKLGLTHSFSNLIKTSWVDSNDYKQKSWDDTVQWRGSKISSQEGKREFGFDLRYQDFTNDTSTISDDDRSGFALKPLYMVQKNWRSVALNYGMSYEHLFAQGKNFRSDTLAIPFTAQRPFGWEFLGKLGLTYSYVDYGQSTNNRADGNLSFTGSFLKKIAKNISGQIEYGYTKNSSTLDSATYDRQSIELKVNGEI